MLDPQGGVVAEIDKTIPPEQDPDFKAEQTAAVKAEENQAAEDAAASKKTREANEVVELAKQAEGYLDKASGSYIDTAQSFGKRVFGTSDEETQANAALKVISGKMVSNMPRMEGPQSDKDVQLYKDMAANIADPTVPAEDKRTALQALRDLNAKYTKPARKVIKFGDLKEK